MDNYDAVLRHRLDYVEEQLARLFPDRYISYAQSVGDSVPAEVVELARAGKTIAAIAAYRQHTGVGLKEAKEVVDSL